MLTEEFSTAGGTDAAVFSADGKLFVAVSNSLTVDVRFRTDTIIYRFNG
jgi:EPTP domain